MRATRSELLGNLLEKLVPMSPAEAYTTMYPIQACFPGGLVSKYCLVPFFRFGFYCWFQAQLRKLIFHKECIFHIFSLTQDKVKSSCKPLLWFPFTCSRWKMRPPFESHHSLTYPWNFWDNSKWMASLLALNPFAFVSRRGWFQKNELTLAQECEPKKNYNTCWWKNPTPPRVPENNVLVP